MYYVDTWKFGILVSEGYQIFYQYLIHIWLKGIQL
jgi:hypothetical protein